MEVKVWAAELNRPLSEREEQLLLRLLPPSRRERIQRAKNPDRRGEALCGYALLLTLLRDTYGWKNLPEMDTMAYGKPFFPSEPEVCFNLSHTAGAVLVGVHDQPLGVDIQRLGPVGERLRCLSKAGTEQEFYEYWVRREARVKRLGGSVVLQREDTSLGADEQFFLLDTFLGMLRDFVRRRRAAGALRRIALGDLLE